MQSKTEVGALCRTLMFSVLLGVCFSFSSNARASTVGKWLGLPDVGKEAALVIAAAIDRTLRSLNGVHKDFHVNVTEHIKQVDEISAQRLREFESIIENSQKSAAELATQLDNVVEGAVNDLGKLAGEAFSKAEAAIRAAECLSSTYAAELKRLIGESIKLISDSEITIRLPLGAEGKLHAKHVAVADPDKGYEALKSVHLERLKVLHEEAPVLEVFSAYGNIARAALATTCHYKGPYKAYFLAEYAYYDGVLRPWMHIAGLANYLQE